MSLDVMKQALEVLEEVQKFMKTSEWFDTRTDALRAAIEQAQPDELMIWKSRAMSAERIIEKFMQPEPKPVFELGFGWFDDATKYPRGTKLYATPPRQWRAQEPVAWVYPEALEAFKNGKPWTAYGSNGDGPYPDGVQRIPLYLSDAVAQRVEPRASESGAGFESLPASPNQPEKNA